MSQKIQVNNLDKFSQMRDEGEEYEHQNSPANHKIPLDGGCVITVYNSLAVFHGYSHFQGSHPLKHAHPF